MSTSISDKRQLTKQMMAGYPHSSRVLKDCEAVYKHASFGNGLLPRLDYYTFENGQRLQMLSLQGIIPVQYRNQVYNIPLTIWLPSPYPTVPPFAFVTPTANMVIRTGPHIDHLGRFYHPYLTYWSQKQDTSCLLDLLTHMQQAFSQEPPVFSKPPPSASQAPLTASTSMPLPSTANANTSLNIHQTSPNVRTSSTPSSLYGKPLTMPTPLMNGSSTSTSVAPNLPSLLRTSAGSTSTNSNEQQDQETATLLSMKSAVQEKWRRFAQKEHEKMSVETESLLETNRQLGESERRIQLGLERLREEIEKSKQATLVLRQQNQSIQTAMEAQVSKPTLSPDDFVIFQSAVHRQLFDLVADDHALEDTIYYISKRFNSGSLPLNVFLKMVRSLAVEQFMKRALILKIRKQLRLE